MNSGIEKVETATGKTFKIDECPRQKGEGVICPASVTAIDFTMGDAVAVFPAGYSVSLSDGRKVELSNVVEVWYAAEPEPDPVPDPRDVNEQVHPDSCFCSRCMPF